MIKKTLEINYTEGEGVEKIDFSGVVVIKRLDFSEKNALEEEGTDVKILGGVTQVKISSSKIKEFGILKSIVSNEVYRTTYESLQGGEFKPISVRYHLDMSGIRGLPATVGELLFNGYSELNTLTEKKDDG